jgi:hypothetical protein
MRENVIMLISSIGEAVASEEMIGKLLDATSDRSSRIRRAAATALKVINIMDKRSIAISKLINLTRDSNVGVRIAALRSLSNLLQPPLDDSVKEVLLSALDDPSLPVQISVVEAISNVTEHIDRDALSERLLNIFRKVIRRRRYLFSRVGILQDIAHGSFTSISYKEGLIRLTNALANFNDQTILQRIFEEILNIIRQDDEESYFHTRLRPELFAMNLTFTDSYAYTEEKVNAQTTPEYVVSDFRQLVVITSKDWHSERVPLTLYSLARLARNLPITSVVNKLSADLNSDKQHVRVQAFNVLEVLDWRTVKDYPKEQLLKALEGKDDSIKLAALNAAVAIAQGPSRSEISNIIMKRLRDSDKGIQDKAWEYVQKIARLDYV